MQHSPFAAALFDGLRGAADIIPKGKGDGLITATELYLYLRDQVEVQTIDICEAIRQTPGIFPLEKHDKGEYVFFSPNHILNLPPDPGKNPYKGLHSYEEADADLFYGRVQVIKELLGKIEKSNLVVVTGASGTGKSSVVKAGLLPGLRRQGYHILPVIQPGKSPVYSLEKAFRESHLYSNEFSFELENEDLATYLAQHKTILIIDHLEKLIRQSKKEEQNRFIQVLKKLLDADLNNQLKIILTLRSDFEHHFKSSALEPYWQDARFSFPSITAGELREIIINPIVHMAVEFESIDFVNTLFEDFNKAPGALPLLSFTLNKLYQTYINQGGTNRILPKTDYAELTDVGNPLYRHATSINLTFTDSAIRKTLSKIMMRLISIDGDKRVGRKALLTELEFSDEENEKVKYILDRLLEKRLIVIAQKNDQSIYLELAHPKLITIWKNLEILPKEQDRNRILLQNSLTDAVKSYEEINDKNLLWYHDPRLKIIRQELTSPDSYLNIHEIKFIEESIKLKEIKKKRKKNIILTVITVLLISLTFAIYKGKEATKKTTIARANYLASQAQLRLESDPAAAISLAKDAYLLDQNPNVARVLSAAAAQTLEHPLYNANLQHDYYVNSVTFSLSGNKILTASEDNTAKLWDSQGKLLYEFKHEKAVTSAVFSPDERTILTVSRDKVARLWNLQGQLLQTFPHEKIVNSAVFSPDGRTILTASDDNTARLWNSQGELLKIITHRSDVNSAQFSTDGSKVLTVSRDLNAWLLDLQGKPLKGLRPVNSADFSPGGKYILFVLFNNTLNLLNLADNTEKILKGFNRVIFQAAVTPDEKNILISYLGGSVAMLDLNGQTITTFELHKDTVNSLVFSPDGSRLLTTSKDRTAKLWEINGKLIADLHLHKDSILAAAFSPDGSRILTASKDNTAKLWDIKDQLSTQAILQHEEVKYITISSSGTHIITISGSNN
ncbi:MAG: WD40 repeat domain-containing protein, partial [Acidobacteria bacterium]|nr:WD40 repeat domain-containing protein [Acidobacteriota bacterium]